MYGYLLIACDFVWFWDRNLCLDLLSVCGCYGGYNSKGVYLVLGEEKVGIDY